MVDDPDEARLPACVRRWRENLATHEGEPDAVERAGQHDGMLSTVAHDCLEWLATAPPQALLLAASAAGAEVLREVQAAKGDATFSQALAAVQRARVVDASTHVCLPRAELERCISAWDTDSWHADEIRALLARETGKGEG